MAQLVRNRTLLLSALGLTIFLLCWIPAQHFVGTPGMSAVWPANAVALAFVVRMCDDRRSVVMALAVTVVAMIAANLLVGRSVAGTWLFPLANLAEIAVAAWFLRNVSMPMAAPRDLGQFLLGAVLAGPLVSTLMAAGIAMAFFGARGEAIAEVAGSWLMADALGMAIVAPFLLSRGGASGKDVFRVLGAPTLIFAVAFALCFQTRVPLLFLAFPMVALAVLNDRGRGGALAVGAVAGAVIGAAFLGHGPVAKMSASGLDPVQVLQVFFAALVVTVHPLAIALTRLDDVAAGEQRRRVAAEADNAAKSQVLGRVGEELRSPLTGVVTVAEMLRSGRMGELNGRQRELLACIAESGAEIEALSHEMMVLAEGGESALVGDCSVKEAVEEAVAGARFLARRTKVEIQALDGVAAWRVGLDADRLRRLTLDGLTRAIEASTPGGVVRIVVGLDARGLVEIAIDDASDETMERRQAVFAVSDASRDRAAVRRLGGDIGLTKGSLGGARLTIALPRMKAIEEAAA